MKNIGLFIAVVLLSVNVYSQTTIETFKADFKKIVLDKKFQVWEERHFKVLFDNDGMISLTIKPVRQYIDLSKKAGINDLNKVKIDNVGFFKKLSDYYKIIIEDGMKKEFFFDEIATQIILKKNLSFLESIKDVTIYHLEYEYMSFEIFINNDGWRIIGVHGDGIYDTDAGAERDKLVIHVYKTNNFKLYD